MSAKALATAEGREENKYSPSLACPSEASGEGGMEGLGESGEMGEVSVELICKLSPEWIFNGLVNLVTQVTQSA